MSIHRTIGRVTRSRRSITHQVAARCLSESLEVRRILAAVSWDGGGDGVRWLDANNWNNNAIPASADDVTINVAANPTVRIDGVVSIRSLTSAETIDQQSGSLTLAVASSVSTFTFRGGTMAGAGNLTITSTLEWQAGDMTGTGQTIIATGAALNLTTNNGRTLARTLDNNGAATWTEQGAIYFNSGTFQNDGSFVANSDNTLIAYGTSSTVSPANLFDNNGTFIKRGTGRLAIYTSTSGVPFRNDNAVTIEAGTLELASTSSHTGDFAIAAGATLDLRESHTFPSTSDLTGAGELELNLSNVAPTTFARPMNLGLIDMNSGDARFNGTTTFGGGELSGGSIAGNGDITLGGQTTLSSVAMAGIGRTIVPVGATTTLNGGTFGLRRALRNDGNFNWTGGYIDFNNGNFINDGTFIFDTTATQFYGYGTAGTPIPDNLFTNNGSFIKRGTGTTRFATYQSPVVFDNLGTVTVEAGTFGVERGSHGGDFVVSSGAWLELGRLNTFAGGADLTGSGNLLFDGSGSSTGAVEYPGAINTSGIVEFRSGTVNVGGTISAGTLRFTGATAVLASNAIATDIDQTAGVVQGSGDLTATATFDWTGGVLAGSGITYVPTGAVLDRSGNIGLERLFVLDGTGIWRSGNFYFLNGTFTNNGSLAIETIGGHLNVYGDTRQFVTPVNLITNNGTITKTGTSGVYFYLYQTDVPFSNASTVRIEQGEFAIRSGGTQTGDFVINPGALLDVRDADTTFAPGSDITGNGNIRFNGSNSQADPDVIDYPGSINTTGYVSFESGVINIGGTIQADIVYVSGGRPTIGGVVTARHLEHTGGVSTFTSNVNVQTVYQGGGTFFSDATLAIATELLWRGGEMAGAGTTDLAVASKMKIYGGTVYLTGTGNATPRTLRSRGTAEWQSGAIAMANARMINDGTFTAQASFGELTMYGGYAPPNNTPIADNHFVNNGTFIKRGMYRLHAYYSSSPMFFDNTGTVNVTLSGLELRSGGTHTGDFTIPNNAYMTLDGDHNFSIGSDLIGNGDYYFTGSTSLSNSADINYLGSIDTTGVLGFSGAITTIGGSVSAESISIDGSARVRISGTTVADGFGLYSSGQVFFDGSAAILNGAIFSGRLDGTGTVTFTQSLDWAGGTMAGTGTTVVAIGGTLTLANTRNLGRTLRNDGNALWLSGSTYFYRGTFANEGTLIIDMEDQHYAYGYSNFDGGTTDVLTNRFVNRGTVIKRGYGNLDFTFSSTGMHFDNVAGTVTVERGRLGLYDGGDGAGDFSIAAGAVLDLRGSHVYSVATQITGTGLLFIDRRLNDDLSDFDGSINVSRVEMNGNNVNFDGGLTATNLVLRGGTLAGSGDAIATSNFTWQGGIMAGSGTTRVPTTATMNIIGGSPELRRRLDNDGNASWTGGYIYFLNGTFQNDGTLVMDPGGSSVYGYGQAAASGQPPAVNQFIQSGTFIKRGPGGAGFYPNGGTIEFDNRNGVRIEAGGFGVPSIVTQFDDANDILLPSAWYIAAGSIDFPGGQILENRADITIDTGGSIGELGALRVNEGALKLLGGADLTISPNNSPATLENRGRVELSAGTLLTVNGRVTHAGTSGPVWRVEIGGTADNQLGRVVATGAIDLASPDSVSRLEADLVTGYDPSAGTQFVVFTGQSLAGAFGSFVGDVTPGNKALQTSTTTTTAVVTVSNSGPTVPPPSVTNSSFDFNTRQAIVLTFNTDVGASLARGDFGLLNRTTGQTVATNIGAFNYNAATRTATLTLTNLLADGNYRLTIQAASVTNSVGIPMAANVVFDYYVLQGDVDRDRVVGFSDLLAVAQNYAATGRTFSTGNIDYSTDGRVDFNDLLLLAQSYGKTLPALAGATSGSSAKTSGVSGRRYTVELLREMTDLI